MHGYIVLFIKHYTKMTRKVPTLKLKSNNSYNPNNKKIKKKMKDGGIVARGKLNSQSTLI